MPRYLEHLTIDLNDNKLSPFPSKWLQLQDFNPTVILSQRVLTVKISIY